MTEQELANLLAYLFDCAWHHEPPAGGSFPRGVRSMTHPTGEASVTIALDNGTEFLISVKQVWP